MASASSMTASMLGRWDRWYGRLRPDAPPMPYGASRSYRRGADWLASCALVEDWGCGTGWLRTLVPPERYRGLDGTASPFADEVCDLTTYRSAVPGVFMRHVLEHNHQWRQVLDNALASFTQRMALVLFTPMAEATHPLPELDGASGIAVPVISFRHEDLVERFGPDVAWSFEDLASPETWFRTERIYLLERA
jgi:hypothetical protein